ncbi:MAG: Na/Pi cotransporter family protein [Patescibacteria group bacterium]|nr:Na/Pi cotransporter family protein [Patescibacteria group bacterium]
MIESEIIFEIIGGLALLLYGIHLLGVNLQKVLGFKLEEVLKKTNNNPIKGLGIGAGITAIIQSSGTTAMMLIGFLGAGLLSLRSAIPVMLGANIGSTVTTQLASFQIGMYALPILTVGVLIHIFSKRKIYKNCGEALIGFSLLFVGMNFIFSGTQLLSFDTNAVNFIKTLSSSATSAVLIAAVATLFLRSSSATSIFIVAFIVAGIIEIKPALFLILGVNLGASLKILYFALIKRNFLSRFAVTHLLFNLFGLLIFSVFFNSFYQLTIMTSNDVGRQVANAHTLYNIINALIFLPFIPFVAKFINKYISTEKAEKRKFLCLNRKLLYTPSVALSQANRAVADMAKTAYEMLENTRLIFFEDKVELAEKVEKMENDVDEMTEKISEYIVQISWQNLSKKDSMKVYSLMHTVTDLEHLADHLLIVSELLIELKERNVKFSEKGNRELMAVFGKLKIMQNLVIKSLEEDNLRLAYEIIKHENKVDEIVEKSHRNHIERLKKGACSFESGEYFSKLLNNLERVGDHSDNIAYAFVDRFRYKQK